MSVTVTVAAAGLVYANSAILLGIAASCAAALGLKTLDTSLKSMKDEKERLEQAEGSLVEGVAQESVVEVTTAAQVSLEEMVAERCEAQFSDERMTLTVSRDIRGKLTVKAHGRGVPQAELHERAAKLLGMIQQQLAYRAAMKLLKSRGFEVTEEERTAEGIARIRVVLGGE